MTPASKKKLQSEKKKKSLTKEDAIASLKEVLDPELQLDIWTLGLIYDITIKGKDITILMTFTSPTCPYGPMIVGQIKTVLVHKGFSTPSIDFSFDPPWQPTEEVKQLLGLA